MSGVGEKQDIPGMDGDGLSVFETYLEAAALTEQSFKAACLPLDWENRRDRTVKIQCLHPCHRGGTDDLTVRPIGVLQQQFFQHRYHHTVFSDDG